MCEGAKAVADVGEVTVVTAGDVEDVKAGEAVEEAGSVAEDTLPDRSAMGAGGTDRVSCLTTGGFPACLVTLVTVSVESEDDAEGEERLMLSNCSLMMLLAGPAAEAVLEEAELAVDVRGLRPRLRSTK